MLGEHILIPGRNTLLPQDDPGSQSGSVLLITILILLFLTILGISAMNMTSTEYQITRNYHIYKKNLYRADAAVMEAAQRFENVEQSISAGEFFISPSSTADSIAQQDSTWSSTAFNASVSDGEFIWYDNTPNLRGVSLSLGRDTPHEYFLYGRGNAHDGEALIKIGYRKAF